MKNNIIGKKQFTKKNQKNFANMSCDYNPIHVDPLTARRLIPGRCIVHGINILLTGLNFLFEKKINFKKYDEYIKNFILDKKTSALSCETILNYIKKV